MAIVDGKIRCGTCGEWKPQAAFRPSSTRKGSGRCRPCEAKYQREWNQRNPDRAAATRARWKSKKSPEELRVISTRGRERARVTGARLDYLFKNKYGIRRPEYDRLHSMQAGVCAICKRAAPEGKRLYVDHDHKSGEVRGLLCQQCNTGIGMFSDDAQRMRNAIEYLQRSAPCLSVAVG